MRCTTPGRKPLPPPPAAVHPSCRARAAASPRACRTPCCRCVRGQHGEVSGEWAPGAARAERANGALAAAGVRLQAGWPSLLIQGLFSSCARAERASGSLAAAGMRLQAWWPNQPLSLIRTVAGAWGQEGLEVEWKGSPLDSALGRSRLGQQPRALSSSPCEPHLLKAASKEWAGGPPHLSSCSSSPTCVLSWAVCWYTPRVCNGAPRCDTASSPGTKSACVCGGEGGVKALGRTGCVHPSTPRL